MSNTSSSTSSSDSSVDAFEQQLRDHFDLIVELLEDRIVADLERRGGRFRGDF